MNERRRKKNKERYTAEKKWFEPRFLVYFKPIKRMEMMSWNGAQSEKNVVHNNRATTYRNKRWAIYERTFDICEPKQPKIKKGCAYGWSRIMMCTRNAPDRKQQQAKPATPMQCCNATCCLIHAVAFSHKHRIHLAVIIFQCKMRWATHINALLWCHYGRMDSATQIHIFHMETACSLSHRRPKKNLLSKWKKNNIKLCRMSFYANAAIVFVLQTFFHLLIMFTSRATTNKLKMKGKKNHRQKNCIELGNTYFCDLHSDAVLQRTQLLLPTRFDLHDQTTRLSVDCRRNS